MQQIYGRSLKKVHFGHSENGKRIFHPKKMKTSLGNIVCHFKMHPYAQYKIIWTNYVMNVAIRLSIWLESHESSHMIAHFREHFFKIIVILQVYYFSWKLGHIWWHNAKVFQFFWIFYARFKMRSKRREWPFLASSWILENIQCFSD